MISLQERISLIRNSLRENKVRQGDVAERIGVYPGKVSLILNAQQAPSIVELLKLVKESGHDIQKVFPDIQSSLTEIVGFLESGESENAVVNLINLLDLSKHYETEKDTKATR